MKLIIHHHALVFKDEFGFWFPSFIGSWINEILNQIEEVAFLGELSQTKLESQDNLVHKPNFKFLSIGTRGVNTSNQKKNRIKQIGIEYSSHYNKLLIRGITPKQYQVFKAFNSIPTSFLMVGSLLDSKPKFKFNYVSVVVWLLYFIRRYQLRVISKKSKVFANSPQIILEFFKIMDVKAEFVPTNTIQNSHFKGFTFRGFQSKPVLLFCGRIVKEKGIEELIFAIGKLRKSGRIVKLHIVGSIAKPYKLYLEKLIVQEGIETEVIFEGFIKFGDDLLDYYKRADIYILPSYHEGFPHSIWEAACSCTPIITTNVGGIPGLVSDSMVTFINVKSVESLVENIEKLILNPTRAKTLAFNAYKNAEKYTLEKCVSILITKIENV